MYKYTTCHLIAIAWRWCATTRFAQKNFFQSSHLSDTLSNNQSYLTPSRFYVGFFPLLLGAMITAVLVNKKILSWDDPLGGVTNDGLGANGPKQGPKFIEEGRPLNSNGSPGELLMLEASN